MGGGAFWEPFRGIETAFRKHPREVLRWSTAWFGSEIRRFETHLGCVKSMLKMGWHTISTRQLVNQLVNWWINSSTGESTRQLVSRISSITSMIDDIRRCQEAVICPPYIVTMLTRGEMGFSQRKRPRWMETCHVFTAMLNEEYVVYQKGFAMQIDIQLQSPLVGFQIRAFTCLCSIGS